jgi:alpha-beta hydrolase superfamily lysophospholipase
MRQSRSIGSPRGRNVMQSSTFAIVREGAAIFVRRWAPDGPPRAAVQIAHGLAEHSARYERVATALTSAGYAVYASDHRGHGPACAPSDLGFFAEENGWRKCLDDLWAVNRRIAADFPRLPIVFMGHSLGSIMGQQFIAEHGADLAGAVLSGTSGQPPAILPLGRLLARFERWRSRDPAEVDKYVADPLCGFPFTTQLAIDLLDALGPIASKDTVARIPKTLPIYVFSGARDPVSANLRSLVKAYGDAGLAKVTTRIYPDARHETLNESNRDEVVAHLIGWLRTVAS